MKSTILNLFLLCFFPLILTAQTYEYPDWVKREHFANESCGLQKCLAHAEAQNPDVPNIVRQNNKAISNWINQRQLAIANGEKNNQLFAATTIPVVVHLVYADAVETLTDQEVVQMIEEISIDFQHLNSDAGNAPQAFLDIAADVEIDFCLAQRDPQGLPTNGITRTVSSVQFFTVNDEIKDNAQGGKDAWDASEYLNIWVGKLSPGLGGYATLPGTVSADLDGVVISSEAIQDPDYLGKGHRILVHEIGHWFNLQHVFGLGPCDEMGDFIDDTYLQLLPTQGCPTEYPYLPAEDIQLAENIEDLLGFPCLYDSLGHNYTNYMDYSNPSCMNMFTLGQKDWMQAALNTQRASLLTSDGCILPTNLPILEANLETLLSPSGEICPGDVTASVYIRNLGQNNINALAFSVLVNGESSNFDWTGNITTGEAIVIEIPTNSSANLGNNNLTVSIDNVNGTTDGNNANNQKTGNFNIYNGTYVSSIEEGFEGSFPPTGWELEANGINGTEWIQSNAAAASGNNSMKGNNFGSPGILFGPDYNYIYLPRVDLGGSSNPVLSFDLAYKIAVFANSDFTEFNVDIGDEMAIEISRDCGQTFQSIFSEYGESLATVFDTIVVPDNEPIPALDEFTIGSNDWENIQLSLADYVGEKLIIRFLNIGLSQPIYVDNINLTADQELTSNFDALTAKTICVDGEVDFDFTGFGAGTYQWTFEGGSPSTSTEENPVITYTQPGVYDVELIISDGTSENTETKTDFIIVQAQPTAVITQNNPATSSTATDGSIQAEVFDGVAPYTFELLPDNIINTTGLFENLAIGDYTVTIYNDDSQCYVDLPVSIDVATNTNEITRKLAQINISPNPNNGSFEVLFKTPFAEDVELTLLDVMGRVLKNELVLTQQVYHETWELKDLSTGVYFLKAQTQGEFFVRKIVIR